jgi:hypothetical protein
MRTANSLGSDEQQQVSDTSLPNRLGRQRTISAYRPYHCFFQSVRPPYLNRERSEATINPALAIADRRRISGSSHHFRIIAGRDPIGFDKPRAILKIPKTGIQ